MVKVTAGALVSRPQTHLGHGQVVEHERVSEWWSARQGCGRNGRGWSSGCKMRGFWGSNAQVGGCGGQDLGIYLTLARRVDLKCPSPQMVTA